MDDQARWPAQFEYPVEAAAAGREALPLGSYEAADESVQRATASVMSGSSRGAAKVVVRSAAVLGYDVIMKPPSNKAFSSPLEEGGRSTGVGASKPRKDYAGEGIGSAASSPFAAAAAAEALAHIERLSASDASE